MRPSPTRTHGCPAAGALLPLALLLATPAGAAEYVLEQPVAVERLRLDVRLRPEEHELVVRADLRVRARSERVSSFHLWLNQGFRIDQIRPAHGIRFTWVRDREPPHFAPTARVLRFDLSRPIPEGGTFDLVLFYRGRVPSWVNGVNRIDADLTELALYAGWFPRVVGGGEFDLELEVEAPRGQTILTYLEPGRSDPEGRRSRAAFSGRSRLEDVLVVAAPELEHRAREGDAHGVAVDLYSRDLPEELAASMLDEIVWIERFYREELGLPAAFDRVKVLLSPRGGWNYARAPLIVVSGEAMAQGLDPSTPDGRRNFRTLAHEIGHLWWRLADNYTYDDWLNEGLAEYVALRALQRRHGEEAAQAQVREYRAQIGALAGAISIGASLRSDPAAEVLYFAKAAMVLRLLQSVMGEAAFRQTLVDYYRTYESRPSGAGDTVGFRQIAEAHHGESLVWFFQPWIYDATLPQLELEYEIVEADPSSWRVEGTITQLEVGGIRLPVEVAMTGGEREEVHTVLVGPSEGRFSVELPFRPDRVELDPAALLPALGPMGTPPAEGSSGDASALLRRARRLEDDSRPAEAEAIYREVLKLAPDDFYALYRLGRIAAGRGDVEAALELHLRADASRRGYPRMWGWNLVRIGELQALLGHPAEAAEAWRRALGEADYRGSRDAAREGLEPTGARPGSATMP